MHTGKHKMTSRNSWGNLVDLEKNFENPSSFIYTGIQTIQKLRRSEVFFSENTRAKTIHFRPTFLWVGIVTAILFTSVMTVHAKYNDYSVNKPSAFRDYQQIMIWDSEILDALWGLQGKLMFSTGSCFSGGFVDDLTKLDHTAVVTANNWHGFGFSLYDFLPGQTDTWAFSDEYMNSFRDNGQGAPTFEEAYLTARDTLRETDGYIWYWGGIEFPQLGTSGEGAQGSLAYQPGNRAILFSGMWAGNEYYVTSFDYTIVGGRDMLMNDYGWPAEAIITLFSDGKVPPDRHISWTLSGAGSKENLLNAMKSAKTELGPQNTLAVFIMAHGRSSAIMTSRISEDRRTIEYLLIPNGRGIAPEGDTYPAVDYGCTQIEITGLKDIGPDNYEILFPDSLSGWKWRIDGEKRSLFLEAGNPSDKALWLVPGTEYLITLKYRRSLGSNEVGQAGWILWLPEGGGGPPFMSDYGRSGDGEWGIGEHVPGGPALGSPDPASWGHGWDTGGDGWIMIPSPVEGDSGDSGCFIGTLH